MKDPWQRVVCGRRELIGLIGCAGFVSACAPTVRTTVIRTETGGIVRDVQYSFSFGPTIGSLMGAGLFIPPYVDFTREAPRPLVGGFEEFARRRTFRNRNRAVDDYVEFRRGSDHSGTLNAQVAADVRDDRENVKRLIELAIRLLDTFSGQSSTSLSVEEQIGIRGQSRQLVAELREEGDRASGARSCYADAKERVLNSAEMGSDELLSEADNAQRDLSSLFELTEEVATQVMRL